MRDTPDAQRRPRRRWLLEALVLSLLLAAGLSARFDLGARWFGWGPDPASQPAAVEPPARLELPRATARRVVAPAAAPTAADPTAVAATLTPLLDRSVLGGHIGVRVVNVSDGQVVFAAGAPAVTPASTLKLLTSVAALETLGPSTRFRTSARYDAATGRVFVVGGGDPFLASSVKRTKGVWPRRGSIDQLAATTAEALTGQQVTSVRLAYDDTLFSGPAINPRWPSTYIPEDVVPPITALWTDEGHDPPGDHFVRDPSGAALQQFAAALRGHGVAVTGKLRPLAAPETATQVAELPSATVAEIVEHTLAESDNQSAEVLSHHVGLALRQEGSFAAGAESVLETLRNLGIDVSGDTVVDGSGLSRENLLTPQTLVSVLRLAASSEHPALRAAVTGMPVAGFTGSLQWRFGEGPAQALGRVRAKTGTLTGVHGLAGLTTGADGSQMAFVVIADRVKPPQSGRSQQLIDRIAGELGACRCGVGSSP